MSIFSALTDNKIYSFEQAFGVKDITSSTMQQAIREWYSMYYQRPPDKEQDPCQRLPFTVVNKLTRTIFSEYSASITTKGSKAGFMEDLLQKLDNIKQDAMQQALIGGECLIKPVLYQTAPGKYAMDYSVLRRCNMVPVARDFKGRLTALGTTELTIENGKYYTLLELRTVGIDGKLTIQSRLYCSDNRESLGTQIPLTSLPKYAEIVPELELPKPIYNLGMATFRCPVANCVDGSPDGVSVYAPAVGLIHNIDINERQLDGEFENGRSRIIASADMLITDARGKRKLADDLFIGIDDDPDHVGVTIFSPTLREQSYLARKQEYLRNIESMIGLKRGILSEVEAAERTATEITSSAGDYNLTIIDFQKAWNTMLQELLPTCDVLGQMYKLCDSSAFDPQKDLIVDWGDGVLYNRDKTWTEYKEMVQAGMLKAELALAWYFELPHDTPEELQKIRETYLPEMEALLGGD